MAYELCQLEFAYGSISRVSVPLVTGPYSETLRELIADCMALSLTKRVGTASLASRVQELQRQRKLED